MKDRTYNVLLVDFTWYWHTIRCQRGCPVSTPAGRYVRHLYRGELDEAWRAASAANPLVHVCARICAHPCEDQCRRGAIDDPVSIRQLKRTLSDYWNALPESEKPFPVAAEKREEKVAVIGAGPAGLAAAAALLSRGYRVTIFEATDAVGGMLIHGIPPYRLPREVIAWDRAFIDQQGAELRTNTALGTDFTLDDLERAGFAAVFIGAGAGQGLSLPAVEGTDLAGVHVGIEFLKAFNRGEEVEIGQQVAIIGGGNVAIDVARSVRRLPAPTGRREITLLVLEAREQMPAFNDEIHEALAEGIIIRNSVGPKRFIEKDGHVSGVETLHALGLVDDSGCFNPQFAPGSEQMVAADTLIIAIGQRPDLTCLEGVLELTSRGTIQVDPETLATSRNGVFAGGDGARGPRVAIEAIADGLRAAASMHRYITGEQPSPSRAIMRLLSREELPPVADRVCRQAAPILPPPQRGPAAEVSQSFSVESARREAARCLDCAVQTVFNSDTCILCGGCVDVCPRRCLRLVDLSALRGSAELEAVIRARYGTDSASVAGIGTAIIKDEEPCIRCGLCQQRCPTGTITMEYFDVQTHGAVSR